MPAVSVSEFLRTGQQYTLSFQQTGLNPIRAGSADVSAALQFIPNISGVSVHLVGGVFGFFANQYDVTFSYTGDGSDVLADLVQPMLDALEDLETLASFDFLGATTGTEGVDPNAKLPDKTSTPGLPSTSALWAIAIIALLIVFLMSGGAGVVRGVARAAA